MGRGFVGSGVWGLEEMVLDLGCVTWSTSEKARIEQRSLTVCVFTASRSGLFDVRK